MNAKVLSALLCLAPCLGMAQSKLQPIKFDPRAGAPIKRVALLDTAAVPKFSVLDTGGGSAAFGVAGLVYSLERMKSINLDLNADFTRRELRPNELLDQAVAAELTRRGVEVVRLPGVRPKPAAAGQSSPDFSDVKTDADAILTIVAPLVGYHSRVNVVTEFHPMFTVVVRLQSGDGQTARMLSFLSYCTHYPKTTTHVPCLPDVAPFTTDKALLDPEGPAARYVADGAKPLAERIVSEIMEPAAP